MMKKTIFIFFLCSFLSSAPVLAQEKIIPVILYGDAHFMPYSYVDPKTKVLTGLYPQILKKLATHLKGYQLSFKPIAWETGLKKLEKGEIFGLFAVHYRPAARPYIIYSEEPILAEDVVLYCAPRLFKKVKKEKVAWPEGFYGLIFGTKSGFHGGGEVLWNALEEKKITLKEYPTGAENLKFLGPVTDCYFNDKISILNDLKQLSPPTLPVEVRTLSSEYGYLAVTNQHQAEFYFKEAFLKDFNEALRHMKKSGEINQIYRSHLTQLAHTR